MLTGDELIIIGTGITLTYFFVSEVYKLIKNKDWILLGILVLIFAVVIWIIYKAWAQTEEQANEEVKPDSSEKPDPAADPTTDPPVEEQPVPVVIPEEFQDVSQEFSFTLPDETPSGGEINYSKFKEIYLGPEFLTKFTNSIRLSLTLKKKRYREVKEQFRDELSTLTNKKSENTIADMLTNSQNGLVSALKGAIRQCDEILAEIDRRLKTISVATTRAALQKALLDPKNGLDVLTGREEIKNFLALRLYTFAYNPRVFFSTFQNIPVYGPSGVGKTKVAETIGHVYSSCGILVRGKFIKTTKAGLVSQYVNDTAHRTRSVLLSTLESVLFIDEAYDITPPPSLMHGIDHGHEAITELVNFIDKMIGLNVIIVAGYEREMKTRFMEANEGLERRFLAPVVLTSYSPEQLTSILIRFLTETNPDIQITQEHCDYIYTIIKWLHTNWPGEEDEIRPFPKQAGDMLTLSGDLSNSIYGTFNKWPNNYQTVIRNGFNKFLSQKGVSVAEK
jgi:hypothetical protein